MSVVPPPNPNVDRFNNTYWTSIDAGSLSIAELETYFLAFPSAQGTENLLATNTLGQANFYADIAMIGTGNSITFPDGSVQTEAYTGGGGDGDALLAGGTSAAPQVFTGYNEFSNASGQIILSNTTYSHIVSMSCDNTTNVKLDINGQVQIGNSVNSNTVGFQADTTNPNQFDIKGSLGLGNTLNSNQVIMSSNNGSTTGCNVYGDIFIYNPSATKEIQLTSNTTTSHQLDIAGQVTIGVSPPGNTILLYADSTTTNQLDIAGNCSVGGVLIVGNTTNSKIVSLNADSGTDNQLNINNSSILVAGGNPTAYPILLAGYGDSGTGKYGLQVSGGGIFVGNNGGATDSSYFVQIACGDAADGTLIISGNLNVSGTSITLNGVTFTAGTSGLIINQNVTITTSLILQGVVSGVTTSSSLAQSTNIEETVQYNGSIQLFGGTTNRSIYLNYNGQTDLTIEQNYDEYLQVSTGLTLLPNKYSYPSPTTFVNMEADSTTNNQLNIAGNLLASGNIILGSGSSASASLTFGNGSIQTVAYTGQSLVLATYTSTALDTDITPYTWSFTGISNSLGNQVNWILYSNSAITTSSSSTIYTDENIIVEPSALNNYIFGSGTAIQIPYKYSDGTTTTNQTTYYPTAVVGLGGFSILAIADASVDTTFRVDLNSVSNTAFTNGSTLKLVFFAN